MHVCCAATYIRAVTNLKRLEALSRSKRADATPQLLEATTRSFVKMRGLIKMKKGDMG